MGVSGGAFKARSRAMKILAENKRKNKIKSWDLNYLKESIERDIKLANQLKQQRLL